MGIDAPNNQSTPPPADEGIGDDLIIEEPVIEVGDGDGLADLAADDDMGYTWLDTDMPEDGDVDEPEQKLNDLESGEESEESKKPEWESKMKDIERRVRDHFKSGQRGHSAIALAEQANSGSGVIKAQDAADDAEQKLEEGAEQDADKDQVTTEQKNKRISFAKDFFRKLLFKKGFTANQQANSGKFAETEKGKKKLRLFKIHRDSSLETEKQNTKKQNGKFQMNKKNPLTWLKGVLKSKEHASEHTRMSAVKPADDGVSEEELAKYKKAHGDKGVGGNKDLTKKEQKELKKQAKQFTRKYNKATNKVENKTAREMQKAERLARKERHQDQKIKDTDLKDVKESVALMMSSPAFKRRMKRLGKSAADFDAAVKATAKRMAEGSEAVFDEGVEISYGYALGHVQEKLHDRERSGEGRYEALEIASGLFNGRSTEALRVVQGRMQEAGLLPHQDTTTEEVDTATASTDDRTPEAKLLALHRIDNGCVYIGF